MDNTTMEHSPLSKTVNLESNSIEHLSKIFPAIEILVSEVEKVLASRYEKYELVQCENGNFEFYLKEMGRNAGLKVFILQNPNKLVREKVQNILSEGVNPFLLLGISFPFDINFYKQPLMTTIRCLTNYESYPLQAKLLNDSRIPHHLKQHCYFFKPTSNSMEMNIYFNSGIHPASIDIQSIFKLKPKIWKMRKRNSPFSRFFVKIYIRNHKILFPLWQRIPERQRQIFRRVIGNPR